MPTMEFAGVDYEEVEFDSSRDIEGVATDVCGMNIVAEKGPINTPVRVTSFTQAKEFFGNYMDSAYGMYAVKGFFDNGGRVLWINRVCHYDDITDASTCMAKYATSTIKNKAVYESVGVLDVGADVTGLFYKTSDGEFKACTESTANGTDEYFKSNEVDVTLSIKDKYACALGNKHGYKVVDTPSISTKLLAGSSAGDNAIQAVVARYFANDEWIKIASATDKSIFEYAQVEYVETANRTIHLHEALKNDYAEGSVVESTDFIFETYQKSSIGDTLEASFVVNMDPKSNKYICAVVNSGSTGTSLIDLEDEHINDEKPYLKNPVATDKVVYLTGGNDGLDGLCDLDFMGDAVAQTGLRAFNKVTGMLHLGNPETNSRLVLKDGYDYCEGRKNAVYMGYVPSGMDPRATATFRDECGFNTSYGCLYHNWGYVTDPIGVGDTPEKLIPLVGHVLGRLSKHDRTNIDSYGAAVAGESETILGVNSLEFEVDDTNGGIMYGDQNRSVNPIVNLSNNGGIVIWGSRTLSANSKWRQLKNRRIFIYTEMSIVLGTRWAVFRNKDTNLYLQMNRVVKKFLSKVKGLYGDTDDQKFEFVCSEAINDPFDSYLISRVGLKPSGVAEFVFFEFGHKPDGISLSEL